VLLSGEVEANTQNLLHMGRPFILRPLLGMCKTLIPSYRESRLSGFGAQTVVMFLRLGREIARRAVGKVRKIVVPGTSQAVRHSNSI